MFRIDDTTAAASLPTPVTAGTEGYFTEGNPASGVPATLVRADWLNMIQEELRAIVVAGGLSPSKTLNNQVLSALNTLYSGRLINVQTFTASGTYTPTAGMKTAIVEVQGGGGGAGATGAGQSALGGGGGSGSYAKSRYTAAQIGASQVVTIGIAGTGAIAGINSGGTGGTSSFGALASAPGAVGGAGGSAGVSPILAGGGPPGARATGGNIINLAGATGGTALFIGTSTLSGYGAGSPIAGGGGGGKVNGSNPATAPGAGGGGGIALSSDTAKTGGAGGAGLIIVWEYA